MLPLHKVKMFFVIASICVTLSSGQGSCRDCSSRECRAPGLLDCPNDTEIDGCGCCHQCVVECPAKQNCSQVSCVVGAEELGCPNSFEIEPCGCCERCLGDVGEKCGELTGTCKQGLVCRGSKKEQLCVKINQIGFIPCFIAGYHWLDCLTGVDKSSE